MRPSFNNFFPSKKQWFSFQKKFFFDNFFVPSLSWKTFSNLKFPLVQTSFQCAFHIKSNIDFMPIMQQNDKESLKSFNIFSMKFFYSFLMSFFIALASYITYLPFYIMVHANMSWLYPTQNCNQCNVHKFHHLNFVFVVLV
jgi:hypothetical protein